MGERLSWFGVFVRLAAAIAIVLLTYNPSGNSFYHWAMADFANITAVKAFAGALLLVGGVVCIRTAFVSRGTLVWMLTDYGILDAERPSLLSWIALVAVGIILGIGLSWSLLRARVTGQVEVD